MFPVLLKIGPLTVRTYGLMVAVGFFLSLQYILYRAKKKGLPENKVLDVVLYTIVAGLIGGRLAYVLLNWSFYVRHFPKVFQIWEGGLVFYGGFAAGLVVIIMYGNKHREFGFMKFADILAPAVALGHFFGRLGCFSAGCCYGLPSKMPWAVTFTNENALAPLNISLHPTQLYEAFTNIVIFFVLDWFNRYEHPRGQAIGAYLFFYGVVRFHIEFLRGDDRGSFIFGLSPSQNIAVISVVAGIVILVLSKRNGKENFAGH
jgi:phosphatidylglycerol:prolipoprotein diacylglycerol transferase